MSYIKTGILGTLLVLAVSAAIIIGITYATNTEFFVNWAGTFFMCATPFQLMMAIVWQHRVPSILNSMSIPLKGLALTSMFFFVGIVMTPILFYTVGQGQLTPIFIHYVIQSVAVAIFMIIVFGCWPLNKFISNPALLGIATLFFVYALNYIIFETFYDYSYMNGVPFYTEALNPGGIFNAITALTFMITTVSFVMIFVMFEMWPITSFIKDARQPVFGLAVTFAVMVLSIITYYLFIYVLSIDPMNFIMQGPISIIFGAFLVDNMMQFQLFSNLKQPLKGIAKLIICMLSAMLMFRVYEWAMPLIAGRVLPAGPQFGYAKEVWIGTAMLGITFPIINMVSGAFDFWPIKKPNL